MIKQKYVEAMCMRRKSIPLAAVILFCFSIINAYAITWDGGAGDGLWVTPTNWSGHLVPASTDDVWINTGSAYVLIRDGDDAFGKQTLIGRSAGITDVVLEMTGGSLTTYNGTTNGIYIGQYAGSGGMLKISGGIINAGAEIDVGREGAGVLIMTGGAINVPSSTFYISKTPATSTGTVILSGGTITSNGFNINTNGSMDISNTGVLVINGDQTAVIDTYINHSSPARLTACGGMGTVLYDYGVTNAGKTTVWTSCVTAAPVTNPVPASGATDLPMDTHFSWTASSMSTAFFRVYFGKDLSAVSFATPASPEYKGQVAAPVFDPGLLKRDYTYYWRIDEINSSGQVLSTGTVWSFTIILFDPADLGPITVTPNWTGVRSDIPAMPAAGVHPRIYFGPAEKTAINNRWTNTASGQEAKKQLYAYVKIMEVGHSAYDSSGAAITKDAYGHDRIGNGGYSDKKSYYDGLAAGNPNILDAADDTTKGVLAGNMAAMALYYYITDNTAGLQKVAAAAAAYVTHETTKYIHIAYIYDLAYNVMTPTQKTTILNALKTYINGTVPYGTYLEAYSTTSNWAGLNSFQFLTYMAIEGDITLDLITIDGYKRATHNFLTYGYYPSGIGWEGIGKNNQWVTGLIAWARHGENSFIAHPHVRAYAENYLPALMQPYGYAFSGYDAWGGSGNDPVIGGYKFTQQDAVGLKWIFPTNTKVDFLWRNFMEYSDHPGSYNYIQFAPPGYDNSLLTAAIFTSDYATGAWDQSIRPTTEFFDDQGLMTTRSDNTATALGMQFFCRQDLGGHTHGDRNNFNLSALGRTWGIYRTSDGEGATGSSQQTKYKSCLLIDVDPADPNGDGYGIPLTDQDGNKSRQPGKVVEFIDGANATFAAGDATYAYSWEWCWVPAEASAPDDAKLSAGWQKANETLNDFRRRPGTQFYFDLPFYEYAHWNEYPKNERILKRPSSRPMSYVYRTAGLVRGSKPYALVLDDAKVADGLNHSFWWQMQLPTYAPTGNPVVPAELTIESTTVNRTPTSYRCDVILKEKTSSGNRRLLVRVFQNEGYTGTPAFLFNRTDPRTPTTIWPALIIEATNCLDPKFKVLLYPHYSGETLPTTNWSNNQLTVTIGSQTDSYNFSVGADNRTRFSVQRNGCGLLPYDGDMNRDGKVDMQDMAEFAHYWLNCYNTDDFVVISSNWLQ
jgi:hypothetical protein